METTLIDHPKLKVRKRTGSEGSYHDPYAYTEWHVTTPKGFVVYHEGLGAWIRFNGKELERPPGWSYDEWEKFLRFCAFGVYTGWKIPQLERIHRKLKSRCRDCGGKEFESVCGYPGERFEVCVKCSNIHDSYFNESAVL